jgi:L-rhamnose mutarotase
MKNRILQLLFFACIMLSFSSCQSKNDSPQIRRFCFGFSSNVLSSEEINQLRQADFSTNELSKADLENVQIFLVDSIAFMICNGKDDLNYKRLVAGFENLESDSPGMNILKKLMRSEQINLLDRNYKLEQKIVYKATEGQLITKAGHHKRYVLTLEIINDLALLQEYKRIHAIGQAWPEINNNMKTVGIKDMEIYLWGYRAFLIMDTRVDFDMQKDGERWSALPREKEWQEYVAKFQKVNPESKATEKWVGMEKL